VEHDTPQGDTSGDNDTNEIHRLSVHGTAGEITETGKVSYDRLDRQRVLLPRAISNALVDNVAFDRLNLLPIQLAAVFGQPLAIIFRRCDVGIRVVLVRANHDRA